MTETRRQRRGLPDADRQVEALEERDQEIRRLQIELGDVGAERELERADWERRTDAAIRQARHDALGTARRHVAGHVLPSIFDAGEGR